MSESFSPAELLDAEWPSHLLGEILDNLLEGDLTAKEEALAQRRLAKGAREDEDGENARTVLSACLRFAGKKLHGGDGGPAHHHKTASAQASNWCACALAVTRDCPAYRVDIFGGVRYLPRSVHAARESRRRDARDDDEGGGEGRREPPRLGVRRPGRGVLENGPRRRGRARRVRERDADR